MPARRKFQADEEPTVDAFLLKTGAARLPLLAQQLTGLGCSPPDLFALPPISPDLRRPSADGRFIGYMSNDYRRIPDERTTSTRL